MSNLISGTGHHINPLLVPVQSPASKISFSLHRLNNLLLLSPDSPDTMAATETMVKFFNHTPSSTNVQEQRIAALESQVEDLLKWQHGFMNAWSSVFSAKPISKNSQTEKKPKAGQKTKSSSTSQTPPVREPTITVTEIVQTAPATPDSERAAIFTDTESVSTAPTTPGIQTPPSVEVEKATVHVEQVSPTPEKESTLIAYKILDVIQRYGQHLKVEGETSEGAPWGGRAMFAPKVESHIVAGQPIKMILPSFPWKSVSLAAFSRLATTYARTDQSRRQGDRRAP